MKPLLPQARNDPSHQQEHHHEYLRSIFSFGVETSIIHIVYESKMTAVRRSLTNYLYVSFDAISACELTKTCKGNIVLSAILA